jgi:hypothetical protein
VESEVWAAGVDNIAATGAWEHHACFDVRDDRVVIWGAGTGGSYVEAFDAKTGVNLFRFCTEYWFAEPDESRD